MTNGLGVTSPHIENEWGLAGGGRNEWGLAGGGRNEWGLAGGGRRSGQAFRAGKALG
jgi:hypothetical protein